MPTQQQEDFICAYSEDYLNYILECTGAKTSEEKIKILQNLFFALKSESDDINLAKVVKFTKEQFDISFSENDSFFVELKNICEGHQKQIEFLKRKWEPHSELEIFNNKIESFFKRNESILSQRITLDDGHQVVILLGGESKENIFYFSVEVLNLKDNGEYTIHVNSSNIDPQEALDDASKKFMNQYNLEISCPS